MLLKLYIVLLMCFVQCIRSESDQGFYTIVGPKIFRPNSKYHVSVNSQGLNEPVTIKVGVQSENDNNRYSEFKTVTLDPYTTQIVQLDIGNVTTGKYKLVAEGLSGFIFSNKTEIQLNTKEFSVFVQTDKAIYKPGDTVKFRVIVLTSNLKPAIIKDGLNIFIQDAQQNRVKQWNKVETTKGVFSGEMELSTAPSLGYWSINVGSIGTEYRKSFEVDEYVLPKFEVIIDTPNHGTMSQGKITVIIKSKYTYGKFVKGEVTVSAHPTTYFWTSELSVNSTKVKTIDGKAIIEFDIESELGLNDNHHHSINIIAVVKEALTGRTQNSTKTITLHRSKYNINIIGETNNFIPGIPYKAWVKVSYHDGVPVQDKQNKVTVTYGINRTDELSLNENGMAQIEFVNEEENINHGYSIQAQYLDVKTQHYVNPKFSRNNIYIRASLKTENPMVNNEVEIEVTCTENLKYFTYQVLGRGDIIATNTVEAPANSKKHTFRFLASFEMVPQAKVLVYFVPSDGIIVMDSVEVSFPAVFQNTVKIALSQSQIKPGENIDITVTSKPNSFVGLLGIDQSVLLLKKGNDLNKREIFNDLKEYQQPTRTYAYAPKPWMRPRRIRNRREQNLSPRYQYDDDNFRDFETQGTVILTNAKANQRGFRIYDENEHLDRVYLASISPRIGIPLPMPERPHPPPPPPQSSPYNTVTIRKDFPETWIYDVIEDNGVDGRTTIHKKVPDSITSWIITGFAIDPISGFGMTQTPRKLEVFQPFFVSSNLPYSIKRGEVVAVPIIVFNYMNEDVVADVVLDNELQEFEFAEMSNKINETPRIESRRSKQVRVKANNGASVSFMIKPKKPGHITIKVTAVCPLAGDGFEKSLRVVPEGVPQFVNKALFIDLRNQSKFHHDINIEIPEHAVPDSTRVELSVVGDLLGPTIKNLDKLIRLPSGCGEQNMLKFVPNIVILNYLKVTGKLTKEIEDKSLKYMETGYQRELTYKHNDGSFSVFGKSDSSGSTWLTAFVARSFAEASTYIHVDENIINDALSWLSNNQAENGSFPEVGRVIDKAMQGGARQGVPLTAYTLITFLENKKSGDLYKNTINKALDYIIRNLQDSDDVYSLALAAYALQLSDHPSKTSILATLKTKAQDDIGKTWWTKQTSEEETTSSHFIKPNSVNVEITAYGLLAYLEADLLTEALPIMNWLVSQRNDKGGFQSTQDTVMGIKALAGMASHIVSPNINIQVNAEYAESQVATINVNNENAMTLQSFELPPSVRPISVKATGHGFAMAQISYKYHVNSIGSGPRFTLNPQVVGNSNKDFVQLKICTSYIPIGNDISSNMAVMEVGFPSGFTVDSDTLSSLPGSHGIKKVETKDSETVVVLYFDDLEEIEVCPIIKGYRTHKVAHQKPASVIVYDYYDNSREARKFYQVEETSLCDICEAEECNVSCNTTA